MKENQAMFTSKKEDYSTPPYLFMKLDSIFEFTFDLAASYYNKKCDNYYDIKQDSLKQDWSKIPGWLWINPPYGRKLNSWVAKMYEESEKGAKILALLPVRTSTKWNQDYVFKSSGIIYIRGRLRFSFSKDTAPFSSQLVIFGDINSYEIEALKILNLGTIMLNRRIL